MDGLVKREQSPLQIVEMFQNREDHLCYKEINFLQPTKKFEPATGAYKRQVVVRIFNTYGIHINRWLHIEVRVE